MAAPGVTAAPAGVGHGAINLTFDADYDQLSAPGGYITLSASPTINTDGGNLVMGGGTDPTTGYALALNGSHGVYLSGGTYATGAGSILIHGKELDNTRRAVFSACFPLIWP
ncbi:MAG: hypothetical protein WDN72_08100 [Alphaproteobacteria bacterium]